MSAKKIVVANQTSTDVQIRITNPFRAFGIETVKMGKEMNFNFTPFHSCVWEEYFWLKVWYNGKYLKIPAYGKGRGYDDFIYKIRREGIWGKPIGSTETSRLLVKWQ
uniref:Uncharacterized protein n=1 Tax=Tetranychus urticae TaxID=32264 RepID=T1L2F9_TETUR